MSFLPEPHRGITTPPATAVARRASRRAAVALHQLEHGTRLRLAEAQAQEMVRSARIETESIIATIKTQEIDRLAREAITGQAMLRRYSDTVAQGDIILADELRSFSDLARLAKSEIIAGLTTDFCRETRRSLL